MSSEGMTVLDLAVRLDRIVAEGKGGYRILLGDWDASQICTQAYVEDDYKEVVLVTLKEGEKDATDIEGQ